ncbi:substrate-binding domain-containing protein [Paenibacillus sp. CC-CFT747]|nr:substrate-binding domain-containing protein [Paenibacillus sp. CC-CFT747]
MTAIITANDSLASGVYLALNEAGVHIPKDVSVIGCGDSSLCSLLTPSLTSVGFPAYEIGFQACSSLIAQIQGETVDRKLVYEPYLTERQSTSPPQHKDSAAKEKMVIVGSLNMDIIMRVSHIPRVGETILTSDIKNAAGGKERTRRSAPESLAAGCI